MSETDLEPLTMITETLSEFAVTLEALDKAAMEQRDALVDLDVRLNKVEGDDKNDAANRLPLKAWVDWLAETYYYVPRLDDWETNSAMRAELEVLKAAHELAYKNSGTADCELRPRKGWDAIHWHDELARSMTRMADDKGSHQDRHDRHQKS